MSRNTIWLYSGIIFTMFLWGLTFVFFKIAFESFNPISVIVFRLIIKEEMSSVKILGIGVVLAGLILSQVKAVKLRRQKFVTQPVYQYPP